MKIEKIQKSEKMVAHVVGDGEMITDVSSALDVVMSAKYEAETGLIAISKSSITEDFFILSTGLADEILQQFINYHAKLAIYGDFSGYTSKPLKDFIYESNNGNDVFFVGTKDEAVEKLACAKE